MRTDKMSDSAVSDELKEIAKYLETEANGDQARELHELLVEIFDNLDDDDFFGTEGWRHKILKEEE